MHKNKTYHKIFSMISLINMYAKYFFNRTFLYILIGNNYVLIFLHFVYIMVTRA